ncbi:MAG: hypothetical protein HDR09_02595 [Lachnospiraceae bacterium]|nr:hypothetical protein [Lachnospiraceae bacterium]
MKTKKKVLNRLIAYILTVVILSVTIGDAFITADDISTVEATSAVVVGGITVASLAEICLMVGAVAVTIYCAGEVIENREEIARFGYNIINSASETVDGWILSMTDTSGQEYIYGSEALDLIRDTEWEVIQGGLPPDDDDNNDKGDGNKPVKNPMQDLWNFTALGATWVMTHLEDLYRKWVNGEELTPAEQAALEPLISATCNQYDVAAQWSGELFNYSFYLDANSGKRIIKFPDNYMSNYPKAVYISYHTTNDGSQFPYFNFLYRYDDIVRTSTEQFEVLTYQYGSYTTYTNTTSGIGAYNTPYSYSLSANFPVFSSEIAAKAYLKGTGTVTDALNYAKIYREADWLQDDWAGVLIDPLCNLGLTLSQLLAIAQQLGLHAIGNNLTPQELYELLKGLLPGENLGVLPEIPSLPVPVPDPDLAPIYLPSPDAHPIPDPGTTPDPGTKPDPGKDPDSGKEPDSGEDSGSDMEVSDYQVDLRGLFPFCIPFDFIALLHVLDADPVAPCFTFPVVIPALDYREDFKLDLSIFDDVAKVIRICEKVSFLIFLMFATSKVIRW